MNDPVLGDLRASEVRVRFPPRPTGNLYLGHVRSALFNWAFARHYGGSFVLRIEDADLGKNTSGGYHSIIDSLTWLGIDWDEGPEVGGSQGPYRQSERLPIYAEAARALRDEGAAYDCYCTADELEARRHDTGSQTRGYDGFCRELSSRQVATWQAEGRTPMLRFRMPAEPISFDDLVRGEMTVAPGDVPDFAILRPNGDPLSTLTHPLDDAMMGITHVLRGEELMASAPRQIPVHQTLQRFGVGNGPPRYGHLPVLVRSDGQRLSERETGSGLLEYVDSGFLPEGLVNYLTLGWGSGFDREIYTSVELAEAFDVGRVDSTPFHLDPTRLAAINSAHMRRISLPDLVERVVPFLAESGLVAEPVDRTQRELLEAAIPLVRDRLTTLSQAVSLLGFLLVDDDAFVPDDPLDATGREVAAASYDALVELRDWSAPAIEACLRDALVDVKGLDPHVAFEPIGIAVTGSRVGPPLFESLALLGRDRSLRRLARARAGDVT
jgi:glutamyl-tRNA synthetase